MTRRLAVCCAPQFLIAFDFSVMSVSLPRLAGDLGMRGAVATLVFAVYSLAFGSLLLWAGQLADRAGAGRCLAGGLGVFGAGALGTALAPGVLVLLGSRALEGAGAAVMAPASLAVTASAFGPGEARRRALSWYAASISIGFVSGSLVAGAAAALGSWRLAVGMVGGLAAAALAGASGVSAGRPGASRRGSSARITAAMACWSAVLVALTASAPAPVVLLGAGVASFLSFARGPAALLRAAGLRPATVAAAATVTATGVTGTLLVSLYVQDVLGYSPLQSAFLFAGFGVMAVAGRPLSTAVAARLSEPRVLAAGLGVQGAALMATSLAMTAARQGPELVVLMAGLGLGHLIANTGTALVTAATRPPVRGIASALVGTAQYVGAAIASLLLVDAGAPSRIGSSTGLAGAAALIMALVIARNDARAVA